MGKKGVARLDLPKIKPGQLQVFTQIGQGRYKTVHSGCLSSKGLVAVLRYTPDCDRNELEILAALAKCGHCNRVPEVYGVSADSVGILLAQELSQFGSVLSVLRDEELASVVTPRHRVEMAKQFSEAACFLKSAQVIHADIACRNFLVYSLGSKCECTVVKLTDFSSSAISSANIDHIVKKIPQATRWCAPETVAYSRWSHKTDIWSLGATLWELFADGSMPWARYTARVDVSKQLRGLATCCDSMEACAVVLEEFPAPDIFTFPVAAHRAVLLCLRPDPKKRTTPKTLVAAFEDMAGRLALEADINERKMHSYVERVTEVADLKLAITSCDPKSQSPSLHVVDKHGCGDTSSAASQSDETGRDTPVTQCPSSLEISEFGSAKISLESPTLGEFREQNLAETSQALSFPSRLTSTPYTEYSALDPLLNRVHVEASERGELGNTGTGRNNANARCPSIPSSPVVTSRPIRQATMIETPRQQSPVKASFVESSRCQSPSKASFIESPRQQSPFKASSIGSPRQQSPFRASLVESAVLLTMASNIRKMQEQQGEKAPHSAVQANAAIGTRVSGFPEGNIENSGSMNSRSALPAAVAAPRSELELEMMTPLKRQTVTPLKLQLASRRSSQIYAAPDSPIVRCRRTFSPNMVSDAVSTARY